MLDPRFVFLAAIVDLAGVSAYALDTLKGHTKPNRVTWFLWALVPLITLFAQLSEGVGLTTVLTLTIAIGPMLVLIASFLNKQAYWQVSKFDIACGGISLLAIILWAITRNGLTAILLTIVADFMAGLPTVLKSYRFPETESANAYLAGIFSGGITILTIQVWNPATYLFPVYFFTWCVVTYILIQFPHLRLSKVEVQS